MIYNILTVFVLARGCLLLFVSLLVEWLGGGCEPLLQGSDRFVVWFGRLLFSSQPLESEVFVHCDIIDARIRKN